VNEEENEIFPEVAGEDEELDELGQEMAARKAELQEQMGVKDAPGEDLAAQGAARAGRKSRGDSQRRQPR
jgi:hypothetical protein